MPSPPLAMFVVMLLKAHLTSYHYKDVDIFDENSLFGGKTLGVFSM